ncbi:MAG: glycosyltransferase family 2 protein [Sediminibacterium sp.]|nr:glycosyltransferase family 2 protein [Sediminibacterium sp.]
MQISIVIPLLNEEESLPELHEWIYQVMTKNNFSYEIIFIDDGSTDDSWLIIEQLSLQYQQVHGIQFQRNYGKSAALNEGFKMVSGEVVITMDADMQDSPDEIPELYYMITQQNYDIVSGWKKKRYDNTITKNIPSKLFNATAQLFSGIKIHDFNCGLKAYKKKVVKNIEVFGEMHRYIPIIAKKAGFKNITEKIVEHRPRKYGVTKFGWERFINGIVDLITILFLSKFGKKPMQFFGLLGIICFLTGFTAIGIVIYEKFSIKNFALTSRPVFYIALITMTIGIQFFLSGFVAELIVRNSNDRNNYLINKILRNKI